MIYNLIRIGIAGSIFFMIGVFLRGFIVTDHQIHVAKTGLGVYESHYQADELGHHHHEDTNLELNSAQKLKFFYEPESLRLTSEGLAVQLGEITLSETMVSKITSLGIKLYEALDDVRGKMKAGSVHLYGVGDISDDELTTVFVHELGHHIDIYSLQKKVFQDPSEAFYSISWESTTTLKSGQKLGDFVSGYAMTNKYEDFAESFTYYVFANTEMQQKAKDSFAIKKKYEFFEQNIFRDLEFQQTDFSLYDRQRYYWDITKKGFDIQNFLKYLKKEI